MGATTAAALHAESIIIDGLNVSRWSEEVFRGWQRGGSTALNATLAVWQHFRGTIDEIAAWHGYFRRHPDLLMPVLTVDDIARAKQTGRTGVIFGFQNATPIEDRLDYLSIFHALGVRVIQLGLQRSQLRGRRMPRAERDGVERVRRGGGAGDEPTGNPHRPVARRPPDGDGGHRAVR